ncbi:hypothetical protein NY486_26700, partial [Enterobacter hormaechei]|nr:hypothetical protein [Enterobacter hormaechei]
HRRLLIIEMLNSFSLASRTEFPPCGSLTRGIRREAKFIARKAEKGENDLRDGCGAQITLICAAFPLSSWIYQ